MDVGSIPQGERREQTGLTGLRANLGAEKEGQEPRPCMGEGQLGYWAGPGRDMSFIPRGRRLCPRD